MTAIWDGVDIAANEMVKYSAKYPDVPKRIICLTEGQDNRSEKKAYSVSRRLKVCQVLLAPDSTYFADKQL
jgi:hypothetical protein